MLSAVQVIVTVPVLSSGIALRWLYPPNATPTAETLHEAAHAVPVNSMIAAGSTQQATIRFMARL